MSDNCKSTSVESKPDLLLAGIPHAGVITHRCSLEEGHADACICECGKRWQKFKDVR